MRKFKSREQLEKHKKFSKIHSENLRKKNWILMFVVSVKLKFKFLINLTLK